LTKKNGRKDTFLWILSISSSYLHGILFFEGKWEGMELGSGWILYRRKMGEEILYVPL